MSTIISHGKLAGGIRENWNGRDVQCRHCGCRFKITPATQLQICKCGNTHFIYGIPCPECNMSSSDEHDRIWW